MVGSDWSGSIGNTPAGGMPERSGSGDYMSADQAEPIRRFGAFILELIVFNVLLLTLGIGYVVWLCIVMSRGQTPGKQLLGLVVVNSDGMPLSWGNMFVRFLFQWGFWILTGGIGLVVDGVVLLMDNKSRSSISDRLVKSRVVNKPKT